MAQWRNSVRSYGIIAQALHAVTALLVFVQLALGMYAAALPVSMARLQWLAQHKSLGLSILLLVLARLGWRRIDTPPPLPQAMPHWERRSAVLMHRALYLVLAAAVLAGWLHASAAGLSVNWFGMLRIPDLIGRDPAMAAFFKGLHKATVGMLVLLLVVHVGAAVRHAFVLRDGVARRMLPLGRRGAL